MAVPVLALTTALASAGTFGLSTSLQHLVSSRLEELPPRRLMPVLLRTPLWVLGMSLSVVALALHAVALSSGALVVVQPVIVTGVVFAVLIRAALDRRTPSRPELRWATITWAGLAAFLLGTGSPSVAGDVPGHAGVVVAGVLCLAGACGLAARRLAPRSVGKGLWLGVTSGILFGLVAVLIKLNLVAAADGGPLAVATSWPAWVMVACGACAVLVNQRAYQTTRLSVSMPILNIVDVVVALGFAAAVFGERPQLGPLPLAAEVLGLAAMAVGVTQLARLEDEGPPLVPEQTPDLEEAA